MVLSERRVYWTKRCRQHQRLSSCLRVSRAQMLLELGKRGYYPDGLGVKLCPRLIPSRLQTKLVESACFGNVLLRFEITYIGVCNLSHTYLMVGRGGIANFRFSSIVSLKVELRRWGANTSGKFCLLLIFLDWSICLHCK